MTILRGTNVAKGLVPFTDADDYETHDETYGKGGIRSVADATARNNITAKRRKAGMLVYVSALAMTFQLGPGLTDADWSSESFRASLGVGNISGHVQLMERVPEAQRAAIYNFTSTYDLKTLIDGAFAETTTTVVVLPPGRNITSGQITVPQGKMLMGPGEKLCELRCTSASANVINIGTYYQGSGVKGMRITRSVAPSTNAHGVWIAAYASRIRLENLIVEGHWRGWGGQATDIAFLKDCTFQENTEDGVYLTNSALMSSSQWQMENVHCAKNGGRGFLVESQATGAGGLITGRFKNCSSYANKLGGMAFLGNATVPIFDVHVDGGFFGEDNRSIFYVDTYGRNINISPFCAELAGRITAGTTAAPEAASGIGHGIQITANNQQVTVGAVTCDSNSYAGIVASCDVNLVGPTTINNGQSGTTPYGVYQVAGKMTGQVNAYNTGVGTTQTYGVVLTTDAAHDLCGKMSGSTGDLYENVPMVTSSIRRAGSTRVPGNQSVAGNVTAGGNITATGDITAGDDLVVTDDLTVGDDAIVGGDLHVLGAGDIDGALDVGTDLTVGDDLVVDDDASIGGDLTVTGNGSVGGDLTVGDDLTVVDDASVGGDMAVGGASTFAGRIRARRGFYRTPNFGQRDFVTASPWIIGASAANNTWTGLCWSPELGTLVAVSADGTNRVMTSKNGTAWTIGSSIPSMTWRSVCWSPELGLFCAVCNDSSGNVVMTSPDGLTWTTHTSANNNAWQGITWAAELGLFIASASSGTNDQIMTSPDGTTWTARATGGTTLQLYGVTWSPELHLAVAVSATSSTVLTSPDGVTWTARTAASSNQWYSVCWAAERGLFVAVASTGTGTRVMTSPDGVTWTTRTSAADSSWRSVCWAADLGLFLAVNFDNSTNHIMASPDGITWTPYVAIADQQWFRVIWVAELGAFVSVAINGSGNRAMVSAPTSLWLLSGLAKSTTYADDTAAAAGGVPVNSLYRNGSAVMIRVT